MAQSKAPPDKRLREAIEDLKDEEDQEGVVTVLRREANRVEKGAR